MKNLVIACAALVSAVLVGACSSDDATTTADTVDVDVTSSNTFSPATVTIKVGQTVRWIWTGGSHNVVSGTNCTSDDAFKSGVAVAGGTFERKFDAVGTFPYYCEPHCAAGMTGTVVVTQ